MTNENLASIQLSAEEIQRTQQAIEELKAVLVPKLRSLSYAHRRKLLRMGDGNEPFVEKTVSFSQVNPEFLPSFVEEENLRIDFQAVRELNDIYRPLQQVMRLLDDSIMLSGSEAYRSSLAYYKNVKLAAERGAIGAKPIYEELRQRFSRNGPRPAAEEEGSSG